MFLIPRRVRVAASSHVQTRLGSTFLVDRHWRRRQTTWASGARSNGLVIKRSFLVVPALALLICSGCVHSLRMHSMDGEELSGRYRFAHEDTGLIQVVASDGEMLAGSFVRVGRASFVESYRRAFGGDSIVVDGPDISAHGNVFSGVLVGSSTLADFAYGETYNKSRILVKGPLFYWTASLRGDRGSSMGCYFIGSSYTGSGFGRCKNHTGKEYSAEF
jgi:hypothetical protein